MKKKNTKKQPAVFLDRDGTLIEEVNFLSRVEDLRLFPFTADALKLLRDNGFLLIGVTNQSGIGRGIFDEESMHAIHNEIQKKVGGIIDAFYFCPHLPSDGCRCRKPRSGMIQAATADFDIELENSWIVGDKKIDIDFAKNAHLQSILVATGYGAHDKALLERQPDLFADDFGGAARQIVSCTALI